MQHPLGKVVHTAVAYSSASTETSKVPVSVIGEDVGDAVGVSVSVEAKKKKRSADQPCRDRSFQTSKLLVDLEQGHLERFIK